MFAICITMLNFKYKHILLDENLMKKKVIYYLVSLHSLYSSSSFIYYLLMYIFFFIKMAKPIQPNNSDSEDCEDD